MQGASPEPFPAFDRVPPRPAVRTALCTVLPAPAPEAYRANDGRRFLVMRRGLVLGWSNLELSMPPGPARAGRFHAFAAYAEVRDVFLLYREAGEDVERLRAFVQRREALRLLLAEARVGQVEARVDLISEWWDGCLVLHATVFDRRFWDPRSAGHSRGPVYDVTAERFNF